jgi:hypothetical protein
MQIPAAPMLTGFASLPPMQASSLPTSPLPHASSLPTSLEQLVSPSRQCVSLPLQCVSLPLQRVPCLWQLVSLPLQYDDYRVTKHSY